MCKFEGFPTEAFFLNASRVYNSGMEKMFMWTAIIIGGAIGGWIPSLWDASMFSMSGVIGSAAGSILGLWIAFKYIRGY